MNARFVLAPALVAALLAGTTGAGAAATPTLDGKRVKALAATYTPATQDHDSETATDLVGGLDARAPGATGDKVDCVAPRCGRIEFVYQPAVGVRGGLMVQSTWSSRANDIDLYVAQLDRFGYATRVASCGTTGSVSEKVYVPASGLTPGKRYVIVTDFYRAVVPEKVTTRAVFPSRDTTATTVPRQADGLVYNVNCGL